MNRPAWTGRYRFLTAVPGRYTRKRRGSATNVTCSVLIDAEQASRAMDLLHQVEGKPVAFIASGLLSNKTDWAMFLSKDTFKRLEDPGLIIGTACHAIYENSCLRFKSMWWTKQIFDISDFYREATDADVEHFSAIPSILIADVDALKKKTGQWARTRIAFIVDSGILTKFTPQQLAAQAEIVDVPLKIEIDPRDPGVEKLRIPQDTKGLRAVLKFLEEEFYIGVITGLPYEANSKRKRKTQEAVP